MKAGLASRTAYAVALRRASHQLLDHPAVFEDALAISIVGKQANLHARPGRTLRAFVAVRSRYAEDQLRGFVAQGGRQYVVLGAGLDTFAYRNPYAPGLKVFEVDHPDTQAWKQECLRAAGLAVPDALTFVPVDFEKLTLADALSNASGFTRSAPALFAMLGVASYLTMEAFTSTLKLIASMPAGSGIIFDYTVPPSSLHWIDRIRLRILVRLVAQVGERFQLFIEPEALKQLLRATGFTRVEDLGKNEINARYFRDRSDGLRIGSAAGRLASAAV